MDQQCGFACFRKGACGDEKCMLPPITPSPDKPDQYQTFSQLATAPSFSQPDQYMKGVFNESCPRCLYVFTTESDQVKCIKIVYGGTQAMALVVDEVENPWAKHKKVRSVKTFNGQYQLQKHHDASEHRFAGVHVGVQEQQVKHLTKLITSCESAGSLRTESIYLYSFLVLMCQEGTQFYVKTSNSVCTCQYQRHCVCYLDVSEYYCSYWKRNCNLCLFLSPVSSCSSGSCTSKMYAILAHFNEVGGGFRKEYLLYTCEKGDKAMQGNF